MSANGVPFLIFGLLYVTCALATIFQLRDLGWKRFIPVLSVVLQLPLLNIVMVFYTLRVTWSAKPWAARILRIQAAAILIVVFFFLFFGGLGCG